jgi:hypothetical protein
VSSEEQAQETVSAPAKKSQKTSPPAWWKNTYFWLGAILLIVGVLGLAFGPGLIRDPGQKREDGVVTMLYFVGAIVMMLNGWISHRQTVRELEEEKNSNG